ncbi:LysR family transcriptional regulator, partial [Francisella tularensis subsp. holarctica]|nr:LysR family transcriptional regulator [Francisella tularensis subsp. holarctica]
SYFLDQVYNYFYQLINYDVAIVSSIDLEKIDQDRWIIAANIEGTKIPSRFSVNRDVSLEYNLENVPINILKCSF